MSTAAPGSRTRSLHFHRLAADLPETEAQQDGQPNHPINLYGVLYGEAQRIRAQVSQLPSTGHHLKTDLHILRGSLKRSIDACDELIAGMEEEPQS